MAKANLDLGLLIIVLKWILRFGGLWRPIGDGIYSLLYSVYSWIFIITFSVLYTASMCANLYFLRDISQLTDMLFMSMTELALVLKIINFYVNNFKLQHMLQCMRDFRMETAHERAIMRYRLVFLIRSTIIYYICANTSLNTNAVNAAISKNNNKLIYSAYYPGVNWRESDAAYRFVFGYQYLGILFTANINLALDSYFCIMMYMLGGQIIILGNRLASVGVEINGKRKNSNEQRSELIKNIKMHNQIIEFIRNLQHCLWWSFSGQLVLSAVAVGSIANELLRGPMIENMYKYVSNVATAISLILQVFLMCFHGQVVMSESENLQNRMYESNWVEMIDAKQKGDYGKILHIFMERLKQNGQILVGKLYPLSLSTFKSIMSVAYRLLALVR